MLALINKLLDWFKALFWKEEMELTLVGLQYSGKTTFVNVIAPGFHERRPGSGGRSAGQWRSLCRIDEPPLCRSDLLLPGHSIS
ncbi:ADP-ribosylation factor-like protein 8A [Larimichthys crocea]|uniref:Uncharacterized protein n=1 Tax=Larimichthys crocea TaxID=215358 RepID=A0ACD3RAG7_LARCR|nr:ADP-ribosylation factor-like protein 8A [Larimichthys crocea]